MLTLHTSQGKSLSLLNTDGNAIATAIITLDALHLTFADEPARAFIFSQWKNHRRGGAQCLGTFSIDRQRMVLRDGCSIWIELEPQQNVVLRLLDVNLRFFRQPMTLEEANWQASLPVWAKFVKRDHGALGRVKVTIEAPRFVSVTRSDAIDKHPTAAIAAGAHDDL